MDPIIQWFLGLFTTAEWRAMFWLLIVTLAGTHTVKVIWRALPIQGGGHGQMMLVAA